MVRTNRIPVAKKGRLKVTAAKKATVKKRKPSKGASKAPVRPKRHGNIDRKVTQQSTEEPVDESSSRRSSDRRKVPVDRYGLEFIFVPKPQPRSPLSSVTSTSKEPSSSPEEPASSSKLKERNSKSETVKRKELRRPQKEQQATTQSKRVSTRSSKSGAPTRSSKKEESLETQEPSTSQGTRAANKRSRATSPVKINAMSSRQLDSNDLRRRTGTAPAQSQKRVKKEPANTKAISAAKKRKGDEDMPPKSEKRIKETVQEVADLVTSGAKIAVDERKEKSHPVPKKGTDDGLNPRPRLKSYLHEPTFESNDQMPFVSVSAYSKLAIRAVLINSESLMKRLIDDVRHVHHLNYQRSLDVPYDAATYALLNGNTKLLQMIIDDEKKPKSGRAQPVKSLLEQETTGTYNYHMLGHAVRQIQMSRGGKEGINALTKDSKTSNDNVSWETRITIALQRNTPFRMLQQLQIQNILPGSTIGSFVHEAVRYGHNKLAGSIIAEWGSTWFNDLHQQVLLKDNEPLKPFKTISVKKKGVHNVTPFHCACINPNEKYLASLMSSESDFNHSDKHGYRPVHYAAACTSTSPLNLLLQRGAQPVELTKDGENALHRACCTGRAQNVELILQHCKKTDPELTIAKHKSRQGLTPLHLAAKNGHLESIRAMLKGSDLDIDQASTAHANNVTALMLAAQQGHLSVVEYVIKEVGASSMKGDKLKRTALTHAVINGMTHVAAFLLRYGVDPDTADSSGNTAVHYAAAYGWYFCLRILIDAGAKLNTPNEWNLTPLAVAYMKGHMALADLLLQQPGIEINCRDNRGLTLVAATLSATVDNSTIDQLAYLIKEKGADATLADSSGNTPLHLLAAAKISADPEKDFKASGKLPVKVAQLLVDNGVNVDSVNDAGVTALWIAVETGKLPLAKYLAENGKCPLPKGCSRPNKSNLLHHLVEQIITTLSTAENESGKSSEGSGLELDVFNLLSTKQRKEMIELLKLPNADGLTPFLLAISKYSTLKEASWKDAAKSRLWNVIVAILSFYPDVILQRSGSVKALEGEENELKDQEEAEFSSESESNDDEDEAEEKEENEDKNEEENERKGKGKVHGRTALHLLADQYHKNEEMHSDVDALVKLIWDHFTQHKAIKVGDFMDTLDHHGESALFIAVRNRCSVAVQLIEMGCDVNAVRRLPPEKGEELEATGDETTKKRKRKAPAVDRVTILMESVRLQLQNIIARLLDAGADVKAVDSDGNTALHYACTVFPSNVLIVKRLLDAGADVDAKNEKGRTPLHLACNADTGATDISTETLSCLITRGADPFVKDTHSRFPIHYAFVKIDDPDNSSATDPVALCTVLLPRMSSRPQSLNTVDSNGRTALHYAAVRGANICCVTLLRHNEVDKNCVDKDGNTPLALAVSNGHMACTLTLLQAGSNINVSVNFPEPKRTLDDAHSLVWTPTKEPTVSRRTCSLSSSVVNQEWQGVVYLLLDILTRQKASLQPLLDAAIENQKYNLALTLLRMAKERSTSRSSSTPARKNLFHLLADTERPATSAGTDLQLSVAEAILATGVPVDEHKDDASGPHHPSFYAAKRRNVPLLRFFLVNGTEARSVNQFIISSSGHTILTMLLWNMPVEDLSIEERNVMEELISKHGLSLDVLCKYPAPADFTATDVKLGNYWSSEEDVTTPLIHAIHGRNFNVVKRIIKAGADVNLTDAKGLSPVMHAVRLNEPHIVKVLLNSDYEYSEKKKPKHHVQLYMRGSDKEDEEEDGSSDSEHSSSSSGEEAPPESRVFNIQGSPAIPSSQMSSDGTGTASVDQAIGGQGGIRPSGGTDAIQNDQAGKAFKRTSALDVNAVDGDNRNVLHHCVASFPTGGWLNCDEMVKLLIDLGADIGKKDRDGLTPLDYAMKYGNLDAASAITGREVQSVKIDATWNLGSKDDGQAAVEKVADKVDLERDAKEYLETIQKEKRAELEKTKTAESIKNLNLRPHRLSGYRTMGEIVVGPGSSDEGDNATEPPPYDVLLNKVDMNVGLYGFYNFYRMQLIKRKGTELYVLFTNWGRIGDDGQYQKTPFGTLEEAVKEFKSVFRSKTGNDWTVDIRKSFVEHPKKYRLIHQEDTDQLEQDALTLDAPIPLETSVDSALPDHLQKLMADIMDVKALTAGAKRVFQRSRFQLTLTALKRDAILKADSILNEIGEKLKALEQLRKNVDHKDNLDEAVKVYNEVHNLSTSFYFLLPLRGFERTRLPVIDELPKWSEHKSAIELLLKYEIANRLLCAAAARRMEVHPYDYVYSATQCRMERLKGDSEEAQTILHYVHNTSEEQTKVLAVYKLWNEHRTDEYKEIAETVGNRWLLWHGSRAANVVSILQAGLLIAPPQAIHCGHLFGKGIYVADVFEKSKSYCVGSKSGKQYAFLCEAALGKVARFSDLSDIDVSTDPLPEGYNSVQGVGEEVPNPMYDFILKDGVRIPFGRCISQKAIGKKRWAPWLNYNEFIVYNPNQVLLRYMVVFS